MISSRISCQDYSSLFLSGFSKGRKQRLTNRYQASVEFRVYTLNVYRFGRFLRHGRYQPRYSKDRVAHNHSRH